MKFNGHILAQEYSMQVFYTGHHRGRLLSSARTGQSTAKTHKNKAV